jgi:hypothetical protein
VRRSDGRGLLKLLPTPGGDHDDAPARDDHDPPLDHNVHDPPLDHVDHGLGGIGHHHEHRRGLGLQPDVSLGGIVRGRGRDHRRGHHGDEHGLGNLHGARVSHDGALRVEWRSAHGDDGRRPLGELRASAKG